MADFSVPNWLTAEQHWQQGGSIAPFLGGAVSGYDAGVEAADRRAFNKALPYLNEIREATGMPAMEKRGGNWFTDITGAAMGKGKYAENYLSPQQRAAYSLKKQDMDSDARFRMETLVNQQARTRIARDNQVNKQRLETLNEGAIASFSETWNRLTEEGLMGTEKGLAELNNIVGNNPTIASNPFVLQGLRQAEEAISFKQRSADSAKRLDLQQFNSDRRSSEAERRLEIMQQRTDLASESDEHRRAIADARLSLDEAKSESTDENRSALLAIAERKLNMAESLAKDRSEIAKGNLDLRRAELEARGERYKLDTERLKAKLPEAKKLQYSAELKTLQYKLQNDDFSPSEKLTPKEPASETYDRLFKATNARYNPSSTAVAPGGNSPTPPAPVASGSDQSTVTMRDRDGNLVRVPSGRAEEMRAKGYK